MLSIKKYTKVNLVVKSVTKNSIKLIATFLLLSGGIFIQNILIPGLVKNVGGLSPLVVIIPSVLVFMVIGYAIWADEIGTKNKTSRKSTGR